MAKMSVDEALKILDLDGSPSPDEIKKAYYKFAKLNHPDRGGSEHAIKQIIEAYELLSDVRFSSSVSRVAQRKEFDEKLAVIAEGIAQQLRKGFDESKFLNYFEEIFETKFIAKSSVEVKKGFSSPNAVLFAEFVSEDRDTVLKFRGWVDSVGIVAGQSGLSSSSDKDSVSDFPMVVDMDMTHNNKKVKPYRRNYLWGANSKLVISPEELFPRELMIKALKSSAKRSFSKQDMISSLRNKLGATFDGDYISIPIGQNHRLVFYRAVFQRVASWGCNGFYQVRPHEKLYQGSMSIPENEASFQLIEQVVRKLQEVPEEEIREEAKRQLEILKEQTRTLMNSF